MSKIALLDTPRISETQFLHTECVQTTTSNETDERLGEQRAMRAAFQVFRDMQLPLALAAEFHTRLETQITQWHNEDWKEN